MKDKNFVFLEGRISNDYRYMKTRDGREFATFTLMVNSYDKQTKDKTETKVYVFIRIMVFDKYQVEYLKRVKPHNGNRVSILGRVNSHLNEYKGVEFFQNDIVVRDIHIVQTKTKQDINEQL